jgi:hypothetical protein
MTILIERQWPEGVLSLVTAVLPCGIHTRFPMLLKPWLEALIYVVATTDCGVV